MSDSDGNDRFAEVEARIDAANAALRMRFLSEFPALDSAEVSRRISGAATAGDVERWREQGRIFAVPFEQRELYPSFQFDADGLPIPLLGRVLAALPDGISAWQTAFFLVAKSIWLDAVRPIDIIKIGDERAVEAARHVNEEIIG